MKSQHLLFALLFGAFSANLLPASQIDRQQPMNASQAAESLASLVQRFVDDDEIVGAELLIVQSGQPVLHRAFGYANREESVPMATDSLFAIRSMTKPFTGLAAQILVDEGRLEMDAPVARYLPSFDNEKSGAITIRQLLTHRAGFPLSMAVGKSLSAFEGGLREIADLAGAAGPAHTPGSRFEYSDTGSDVLGAVVAAVGGRPFEAFVHERIAARLGLDDTFPEADAVAEKHRARVAARYVGIAGYWTRYWSPKDAPLYPFLKGSGGLYSTAVDYARFLQAWMDGENENGARLISAETFARALKPAAGREPVSTGFPGAATEYGQMWTLYTNAGASRIFAFGHSGSDGTHAYAIPEQDLVVCYFTQSRGHATAGRFEQALSHLFLKPDSAAFARLMVRTETNPQREYTGLYARNNRADALAAIVELEGSLMFEFPGRTLLRLQPTEDPDRWIPERMPNDSVTFLREHGRVAGLAITRRGKREEARRFAPERELPSIDELMELRERLTPAGSLKAALPLRIDSVLEQNGVRFPMTEVFLPEDASYSEVDFGPAGKMRTWVEGGRAWREMPGKPPVELRGIERTDVLTDRLNVVCSDWSNTFAEIVVLARETFQGRDVLRVRTVPREGIASTRLIAMDDGAMLTEQILTLVPGAGLQALERRYAGWREVPGTGGLTLPFSYLLRVAGGEMEVSVTHIEPNASVEPGRYAPPKN